MINRITLLHFLILSIPFSYSAHKPASLTELSVEAAAQQFTDEVDITQPLDVSTINQLGSVPKTLIARAIKKENRSWLKYIFEVYNLTSKKEYAYATEKVVLSSDNKTIVNVRSDQNNIAIIEDLFSGVVFHKLQGHTAAITSLAMSDNRKFIVTGSQDATACIWDAKTGALLHKLQHHNNPITALDISLNNKLVATGSTDRSVIVWNIETGALIKELEPISAPIETVNFSADSKFIVSCANDSAYLWEVNSGSLTNTLHNNTIILIDAKFVGNDTYIASSGGNITLWNKNNPTQIRRLGPQYNFTIDVMTVNQKASDLIIAGRANGDVELWDIKEESPFQILENNSKALAIATSTDNSFICTWHANKSRNIYTRHALEDLTLEQILFITALNKSYKKVSSCPIGRKSDWYKIYQQLNEPLRKDLALKFNIQII